MNEEPIINGIDVGEYFIDVVDESRSTIDYKILPNSERLLVEKIFEQNQQLKRLQEEKVKLLFDKGTLIEFCNKLTKIIDEKKENENKILQILSCANCGEKYLSSEGAEQYEKNVQLQKENEELKEKNESYNCNANCYKYKEANKYKQALEEIREIAKFNQFYNPEKLLINGDIGQIQNLKMTEIYNKINEVLNDRD